MKRSREEGALEGAGGEKLACLVRAGLIEGDDEVTAYTDVGGFFLHPFSSAQANEFEKWRRALSRELLATCLLALCSVWLD